MARPAPGADRSVTVLDLMTRHPDERFTLSEVARRCAMNKATAHALLTALTNHGVLVRHPAEKRYSLGPRLVAIGEAARRGYRSLDFAPYALRRLAASTDWRPLAIRLEGDSLVVMSEGATGPPGTFEPGAEPPRRFPHMPPLGAAFVAWSDEPSVELWLARSPAFEVVGRALEALPAVRRHGFSVLLAMPEQRRLCEGSPHPPHDEIRALLAEIGRRGGLLTEIDADRPYVVAEVAAPVFGVDGSVELVIAVTTPETQPEGTRLNGIELLDLGGQVVAIAEEVTASAHGRHPPAATA